MLRCGQMGADAVERLREQNRQFTTEFIEIMRPEKLDGWPNPFDADYSEFELLLDGSDDGSGLEPHRR